MSEERAPSVAAYEALAPGDAAWARRAVEPYAAMSPDERFRSLAAVNGWADSLLAGRTPEAADGEHPFWMHWRDPSLGRSR